MGKLVGGISVEGLADHVERIARVAKAGNVKSVELTTGGGLRVEFFEHAPEFIAQPPGGPRSGPSEEDLLFGAVGGRGFATPSRRVEAATEDEE